MKKLLELKDSVLAQAQSKAESSSKGSAKPEARPAEIISAPPEKDAKLKKWCSRTKQIWVIFPNSLCKVFNYIDGTLYWPGLDDVAAERANKLSKILDEK